MPQHTADGVIAVLHVIPEADGPSLNGDFMISRINSARYRA
jgi:hypothetical protein